jgi:magnesium chelatase accessory protein
MDWERLRHIWPNAAYSRFVQAEGVRWHVQQAGTQGPRVLLLHGTGASLHTWRDILPGLAQRAQVLAVDLPGHAFSSLAPGDGMSLPGMARGLAGLLKTLNWQPDAWVGHSAGAAIAAEMVLTQGWQPQVLIGINPAWLPLPGLAGLLFPPAAKLLALTPFVPGWFARQASSPGMVEKLLQSTGSTLDAEGTALYVLLVASPSHAQGALSMMAAWDLSAGRQTLRALRCPVRMLVGGQDRTVPPSLAVSALPWLQDGQLATWPDFGHLVHEEAPKDTLDHLHRHLLLE